MDRRRSTRTRPVCLNCGSGDVTPIMYSLPTDEGFKAAERGEVVLGGCIVFNEAPVWLCQSCHASFGSIAERDAGASSRE